MAITEQNRQSAEAMGQLNNQRVESLDAVSAVVEENTASTEEMAAGSGEVAQAIEGIAGVSEKNRVAVEAVSASAQKMSEQVNLVSASAQASAEMAQALQAVVLQFRLATATAVSAQVSGPDRRTAGAQRAAGAGNRPAASRRGNE